MASSPKRNGLQASIDVVRGCVFDKYTHTTMQRAISFHRRYTIVCIFLKEAVLLLRSRVSCMQTAVGSY